MTATAAKTRRAAATVGMEPDSTVVVRADDVRGIPRGTRVTVTSYSEPFWDTVNGPQFDRGLQANITLADGTRRVVCPVALCPEWAW